MKNITKPLLTSMGLSALLLALFSLSGTLMVSLVHEATKTQIDANYQAKLLRTLNTVVPSSLYDNDLLSSTLEIKEDQLIGNKGLTTIYQARLNNKATAIAFQITAPDGYSGEIKILIGILANGKVSSVRVISHKETPGLGDKLEIKRSNWINSFNLTSLDSPSKDKWKVKKDGGDFDQFTGATITPRAVVKAVYKSLQYVKKHHQKLFAIKARESL